MQSAVMCALFFATALWAREHNDVIVMQNGDRITGEIKGLQSGVLKVDIDYVDGAISVQWLKVARIESKQLFLVQTQDGSVYTGMLGADSALSGARPITLRVAERREMISLETAQVVRLEETSTKFFQRLSGSVNLGIVYSKGNNATQYNLGADLESLRERWGFGTTLSSNLSANSGSSTSTHNQLDFSAYRLMTRKNYFYSAFGGFLQSSTQGINLQTTLGVGIGRYLKNTNRVRMSVVGGLAWQSANYQPSLVPIGTQQIYGAAIVTDLNVFLFKKTTLNANALVAPALSDVGRVHANTNVSYYLKLFGDLSWNFSFYGNWDTNPPGTFAGSDYGYSSGLKWTFGYR